MTTPRTENLVLPGVLTAEQAAATVRGILAVQREDGAIPGFRGHHLDPWDHTEAAMALDAAGEHEAAARAYDWLARHQIPYDEIHVGKPWCGTEGFYVDDKAVRPSEFLALSHDEIHALLAKEG